MIKKQPALLTLLLLFCFNVFAEKQDSIHGNSSTTAYYQNYILPQNNPVIQMLDSLANQNYLAYANTISDRKKLNIYNFPEGHIPRYTHEEYRMRMEKLNNQSPFDLVYNNEVRGFIDLYAVRRPQQTAKMMGLAELYFPVFEEYLDKYGLPLELKFLAVIESALNPRAVSRVGASGLWQFMYNTGKVYGLKADSYVDDRYDLYKSTDAACRYLKYLYGLFNDWSLVIAAYNTGEGNMIKAIRRSGGETNFWKLKKYLPQETASYVPAFIAVNYVMNHTAEHNIFPSQPSFKYWEVDTVKIHHHLTFAQIESVLKISRDELSFLNPTYKKSIIPASPNQSYILRLPRQYISAFVMNESNLYSHQTEQEIIDNYFAQVYNFSTRSKEIYIRHVVNYGENIGSLSQKYNCTSTDIVNWNRLKHQIIVPNQIILIKVNEKNIALMDSTNAKKLQQIKDGTYIASTPPSHQVSPTHTTQATTGTKTETSYTTKKTTHVVKSGESLGLIAKKYHCTVTDLKKWNNLRSNTILKGQKLTIQKKIAIETPVMVKQENTPTDTTANANIANNTSQQKNEQEATQTATKKYIYHTVQPGDTLWSISQKYKTLSVNEIKEINKLQSANALKVGQKIKVGVSG